MTRERSKAVPGNNSREPQKYPFTVNPGGFTEKLKNSAAPRGVMENPRGLAVFFLVESSKE
jgi:hypothetical protein